MMLGGMFWVNTLPNRLIHFISGLDWVRNSNPKGSSETGVEMAKDAKNAKMRIFVHFAQIPL